MYEYTRTKGEILFGEKTMIQIEEEQERELARIKGIAHEMERKTWKKELRQSERKYKRALSVLRYHKKKLDEARNKGDRALVRTLNYRRIELEREYEYHETRRIIKELKTKLGGN